jgi:lambda family phage tail tape measure protein
VPTYTITVDVDAGRARQKLRGLQQDATDFGQALTAAAIGAGAKRIIELSDAYTSLQNKLRTVTDGEFELADVTEKTFDMAQSNRVAWDALAQSYSRMRRATENLGLSQQEVLDITDTVAKSIKLSGATATETRSVLLQLSQAFASGRLNGDEFRSVMENSVEIGNLLAKSLGVTRGELKNMSSAGLITTEVMVRAFQDARKEMVERFGEAIPTIAERFQVLKNAAEKMVGEWAKNSEVAHAFGESIGFVSRHLDALAQVITISVIPSVVALSASILASPLGLFIVTVGGITAAALALDEAIGETDVATEALNQTFGEAVEKGDDWFTAMQKGAVAAQEAAHAHMFFGRAVAALNINVFELSEAWAHNISNQRRVMEAIANTNVQLQIARILAATGTKQYDGLVQKEVEWDKIRKKNLKEQEALEEAMWKARQERADLELEDAKRAAEELEAQRQGPGSVTRGADLAQADLGKFNERRKQMLELHESVQKSYNKLLKSFDERDLNRDTIVDDTEGMKAAFRELGEEAKKSGDLVQQAFVNAFHRSEDALAKFMRTGKFDFDSFTSAILDDIARILARQLLLAGIGAIAGGGSGGLVAAGTAALGNLGGAATGADWTVGGSGGTDSQVVAFRATPNEHISVRTPDQMRRGDSGSGGGGRVQIVNVFDPRDILATLDSAEGQRRIVNAQRILSGGRRFVR